MLGALGAQARECAVELVELGLRLGELGRVERDLFAAI
jgi:hypothetical protein